MVNLDKFLLWLFAILRVILSLGVVVLIVVEWRRHARKRKEEGR